MTYFGIEVYECIFILITYSMIKTSLYFGLISYVGSETQRFGPFATAEEARECMLRMYKLHCDKVGSTHWRPDYDDRSELADFLSRGLAWDNGSGCLYDVIEIQVCLT